jgi:hypothetical protein
LERPAGLEEIGYFEREDFDYTKFKPLQPNTAFANLTWRDGYWASKIISAFGDEHLDAIVERGQYQDPRAAKYLQETLAIRRDLIVRFWFDRMPPLDFFSRSGDRISFTDLGVERGYYPPAESSTRYRVRCANVTSRRQAQSWSGWLELDTTEIDLSAETVAGIFEETNKGTHPFFVLECQLDRGEGWGRSVKVFFSRESERIVAVER